MVSELFMTGYRLCPPYSGTKSSENQSFHGFGEWTHQNSTIRF